MRLTPFLRGLTWLFAILGIVALCLFFPRFLRVMEGLMRELRYVWWIILLFALGVWLRRLGRPNRPRD